MKRDAENYLAKRLKRSTMKPLVIRGARQVGKSTLVRQFAQNQNLILNEINLEKHPELNDVFKTLDMNRILKELEGVTGGNLLATDSVLFLDEIQATPYALQALRYFYEERPGINVIAAGSLLEFVMADHKFSMPVGRVEYLHLGPMTFNEFLGEADPGLLEKIQKFNFKSGLAKTSHKRLLDRQREFLFVGGMPEAIAAYIRTERLAEAIAVQRSIISNYQDDFAKYASREALFRLQRVFNYIPRSVGKKVKYSNISREENSREIKHAIEMLSKAGILTRVFHSSCSGLPLFAEIDEFKYKPLFLDVGLMNRVCGLDWLAISSLDDRALINEGAIAEQFIGQNLLWLDEGLGYPRLCYWMREKKSANAEVDYVISRGNLIVPVEVKAGKSGTLKSLLQFVLKKKTTLAVRFDMNPPSIQHIEHKLRQANSTETVKVTLMSLPLYMTGQLGRLLDLYRMESIP